MSDAGDTMTDWRKDELEDGTATLVARSRLAAVPADGKRAVTPAAEVAALRSINARLRREIAALKEREAHALRLADRDGLTGLYNRRRMSELVAAAIGEAERRGHQLGILFIDLDGFKHINDHYGHCGWGRAHYHGGGPHREPGAHGWRCGLSLRRR